MQTIDKKAWLGLSFFILFGLIVYLVQDILLPFIAGFLIAYFLNPVVTKLESKKCNRSLATMFVISVFFAVIIILGIIFAPIAFNQLMDLLKEIPKYIDNLREKYQAFAGEWIDTQESLENIKEKVESSSSAIISFSGKVIKNVWQSGLAVINLLSLLFITPVVVFYMLRDWPKILKKLDNLIPNKYKDTVHDLLYEINTTLAGFIRGQTLVCLALGTFYAVGLSLTGLNFALIIGFFTGIFSFIPYVGMLIGTVAGLSVAFFQFGDWYHMLLVAGVFALGQVLEGSFVTPVLVGDKVGLHPVWLIFGLLAGGVLFGFVGILLAVPLTSVIAVLVRFSIEQYQESEFYKRN